MSQIANEMEATSSATSSPAVHLTSLATFATSNHHVVTANLGATSGTAFTQATATTRTADRHVVVAYYDCITARAAGAYDPFSAATTLGGVVISPNVRVSAPAALTAGVLIIHRWHAPQMKCTKFSPIYLSINW
jgi:hypothetical protein